MKWTKQPSQSMPPASLYLGCTVLNNSPYCPAWLTHLPRAPRVSRLKTELLGQTSSLVSLPPLANHGRPAAPHKDPTAVDAECCGPCPPAGMPFSPRHAHLQSPRLTDVVASGGTFPDPGTPARIAGPPPASQQFHILCYNEGTAETVTVRVKGEQTVHEGVQHCVNRNDHFPSST